LRAPERPHNLVEDHDELVEVLWQELTARIVWREGHWRSAWPMETPWPPNVMQRVVNTHSEHEGDYQLYDPRTSLEVVELRLEERAEHRVKPARCKPRGERAMPDEDGRAPRWDHDPVVEFFPPTKERYRAGWLPVGHEPVTSNGRDPTPDIERLTGATIADLHALNTAGRIPKALQNRRERRDAALLKLLQTHSGRTLGDILGIHESTVYRLARARGWTGRAQVRRIRVAPMPRDLTPEEQRSRRREDEARTDFLRSYGFKAAHRRSDWAPSLSSDWRPARTTHNTFKQESSLDDPEDARDSAE
jgi:hypothetical protein